MDLVKVSKMLIQEMRCSEDEWNSFLEEVSLFCIKHEIEIPKMDEIYVLPGRSRRRMQLITGMHHFKYELYNTVIDLQLQELNSRFNEVNTELLICVASLNPYHSFAAFDKEKLLRFAELYPKDFSPSDYLHINNHLETYIRDVRSKDEFCCLDGIGGLADKLVKTGKNETYPFVYKLIKLALVLPVATASVERVFSAMTIVKSKLRNHMGDQWINDCLVTYIESDIFRNISDDVVLKQFQCMKT